MQTVCLTQENVYQLAALHFQNDPVSSICDSFWENNEIGLVKRCIRVMTIFSPTCYSTSNIILQVCNYSFSKKKKVCNYSVMYAWLLCMCTSVWLYPYSYIICDVPLINLSNSLYTVTFNA